MPPVHVSHRSESAVPDLLFRTNGKWAVVDWKTGSPNPELDQLAGRFSPNRGKLGFMLCRHFENRDRSVGRCRDTLKDDRGLIIAVDDTTVLNWLDVIGSSGRTALDREFAKAIDEIWVS